MKKISTVKDWTFSCGHGIFPISFWKLRVKQIVNLKKKSNLIKSGWISLVLKGEGHFVSLSIVCRRFYTFQCYKNCRAMPRDHFYNQHRKATLKLVMWHRTIFMHVLNIDKFWFQESKPDSSTPLRRLPFFARVDSVHSKLWSEIIMKSWNNQH